MACLHNQHAMAVLFLDTSIERGPLRERANEVCIFFYSSLIRRLDRYTEAYGGGVAGPAIGVLAVKCADFPKFEATARRRLAPANVYALAVRMASDVQSVGQANAQHPLHKPFTVFRSWEHAATNSRGLDAIARSLASDMEVLFADGEQ
jgi:hypothetical protein